jgi:carbamoylphosphate synthase large subunit
LIVILAAANRAGWRSISRVPHIPVGIREREAGGGVGVGIVRESERARARERETNE